MSISQLKKDALASLKHHWGEAICVMLLVALTLFINPIIEIIDAGGFSEWIDIQLDPYADFSLTAYLVEFIIAFLLIPFSVGVSWFFLSLVRSEKLNIAEVFSPYKIFWKTVGLTIVEAIFILLWSLLFIIPGIIKAISYSQTYYILKDNPDMGILDIITESKNRMKGLKGKYFLTVLSFIGWAILAAFTFGIGYLFLVPYVYATLASFYENLIVSKSDN